MIDNLIKITYPTGTMTLNLDQLFRERSLRVWMKPSRVYVPATNRIINGFLPLCTEQDIEHIQRWLHENSPLWSEAFGLALIKYKTRKVRKP